jgi:hypothetical protein
VALAAWAFAGTVLLALALVLRPSEAERERAIPALSYATVLIAVGITMVIMGLLFGMWLWLFGAGVLVLGFAGLLREELAARRGAG